MKIIKEDIENLERYIGNSKIAINTELPLVMADALNDSRKNQKLIDKEFKDADKETELEDKNNKVIGAEEQPVPKEPEEAKINLEESLFEDYASDVRHYSDILSDMIEEGAVDAADIAKDLIYWCSEDDIKRYMKVNGLIGEFRDDGEEIEESLRESKSSMKDFLTSIDDCKTIDDLQVLRNRFDSLKTATKQDVKTFTSAWNNKRKSLKEARKASPFIDSEGNSYGDEDRSSDDMDDTLNDPWTTVYNEIAPENPNWKLKTKLPDVPIWKRYNQDHLEFDYDDNIIIHAEKEEDFDLARRIADEYGLEFKGPRQRKFDKDFIATIIMPKEN